MSRPGRPFPASPAAVRRAGRSARRLREVVRAHVQDGMKLGVFPGAVAAVARRRGRVTIEAFGTAQVVPRRVPMTVDTVFDLASVTKVTATTTAILQLWSRGVIDLDARVATCLPPFAQAGKETVTVRHLLTHTSGLPAWEMLYLSGPAGTTGMRARACRSIEQAVARICATPALAPPGTEVAYSDLGFITLGHLVERLSHQPLDRFVQRQIFHPLGMAWTRFAPPASWRSRCAATEVGNRFEQEKALAQDLGRGFPWRTRLIRGQVHDGNAWHLGRGIAGHAGLFGTAQDLVRFGRAVLGRGALDGVRVLPAEGVVEATRNQTPGRGREPRGLGWAMKGWSFIGSRASAGAFGHTGFTGTSLLVDPERDLLIVLLTNRVHPHADSTAIQQFRPAFHDAVIEALDG